MEPWRRFPIRMCPQIIVVASLSPLTKYIYKAAMKPIIKKANWAGTLMAAARGDLHIVIMTGIYKRNIVA